MQCCMLSAAGRGAVAQPHTPRRLASNNRRRACSALTATITVAALYSSSHGSRSSRSRSRLARSLPEDGHHAPQEQPEAWLLVQAAAKQQAKQQQRQLTVPFTSLQATPELLAISMVYFTQGVLGLSRLALSFFFKDELGLDPAEVAVLTGLAGLPWVIKPLYGFISDSVPLFGYRRRSYLLLCGLAGSASWLSLAGLVHSPGAAVAAMLLGSLSTACSDVVVDSLVVERARGEPASTAGSLQSLCWASSAVGGIASAYFSGSLVEAYGTNAVFLLTAVFPLIVSASALLIDEQRVGQQQQPATQQQQQEQPRLPAAALPHAAGASAGHEHQQQQQQAGLVVAASTASSSDSSSDSCGTSWGGALAQQLAAQTGALWGAVRQRDILLPTIFVFLWQATPSADSALFYFYTNELHFGPEFLGRVRLIGACASLAGVALYNGCFKAVPLKRMLLGAMLLGTALGSTQLLLVSGANRALGLSDELFLLGDSAILTVLGQVSFMPILVLAARLCPEGIEASLFATLMAVLNSGSFVGQALGAGLTSAFGVTSTDFSSLFPLLLLCNLSTLLPAPFLGLLPASLDEEPPAATAAEHDGSSRSAGPDSTEAAAAAVQQQHSNGPPRLLPPAHAGNGQAPGAWSNAQADSTTGPRPAAVKGSNPRSS